MYQDLEQANNDTKQIFKGLVEQIKREIKQRFNKIISSTKPNFFKILDFQKELNQQINTMEFQSLCCLYLLSYSRRQEKYKQEINAFLILITKLSKIRELAKLIKSLKQENQIIEKLVQLRDYLLSCLIKFYFHVYNIKYEDEYGFKKYYNQVDKLITKKQIDNYGSLDQLQQEILKQNISPEENNNYNQEKFLEIVIKTISQYFSYNLHNPLLMFQIHKIIKKYIFKYQDRWIKQLVNFIEILNPQSDIFTENNLINKQQGYVLQILYLQQHLVDSFYKMATRLINEGNYLYGIKMLYKGIAYKYIWNNYGFVLDMSKDYEYLQNCCQYILQHTDKYKSQCSFYQYFVSKQKRQYDQAELYIEEAISLDNKNETYLRQRGNIILDKGHYEEARKIYEECVTLNNSPFNINNIGLTYYYQNDYKQALSNYYSANILKQDNLIINYNIISALFKLEQYDECLKQCESLIEMKPQVINVYLFKIKLFIHQNRSKEAIEVFQLLKKFESSNLWVVSYDLLDYWYYFQIGLYCYQQKQFSSAIYYLLNSIKLNPISSVMIIGTNLQDLQENELSEFHMKIKEKLNLDWNYYYCLSYYIRSYMMIGSVHYHKKNYSNYNFIINNLAQSINIDEIKNSYQLELVDQVLQVHIVQFKFFYALETYFKLNEDSNFKTNIYNNYLQLIYSQTGQLYDNFIVKQIQNDQGQLNLELLEGYFSFYQNNFFEAEFYFEKQIAQNADNIDARLILGNIYQKLKKYDESISQFDNVINLDKTNNWAYIQKAYSYYCMGLKDQIYPLYQEACEFCPDDFELIICNAIYLYESQLYQQALELFDLLFQEQHLNNEIDYLYFRYGMIYYELNDIPNALNKFKQTQYKNQPFTQFINQGFLYEKTNCSKAIQYYADIISIFNYKEKDYLKERIKVLKNSQIG